MRKDSALPVAGMLALAACSSLAQPATSFAGASLQQRQAAAAVTVFPPGSGPPARSGNAAKVEGYFCKTRVVDADGARARAIEEIKYRAVLQGANAIANLSCAVAESAEKCPECWVCVQCEGQAISQ